MGQNVPVDHVDLIPSSNTTSNPNESRLSGGPGGVLISLNGSPAAAIGNPSAAGLGNLDSLRARARQYIQDPMGFGEWYEDFIGPPASGSNAVYTGTTTSRLVGRGGAGKFQSTFAATQGLEYMQGQENLAPAVSDAKDDAWFQSWCGSLDTISATLEYVFCGIIKTSASGESTAQSVTADNAQPYFGAMFHGPTSTTNYCIKVWDGSAARVVQTGIAFPGIGVQHIVDFASDGMRNYTMTVRVPGQAPSSFVFDDDRGMFITQGNFMVLIRVPSGASCVTTQDYFYGAGMRS